MTILLKDKTTNLTMLIKDKKNIITSFSSLENINKIHLSSTTKYYTVCVKVRGN